MILPNVLEHGTLELTENSNITNGKGAIKMGCNYWIRTDEERVFPLKTIDFTDYYMESILEVLKFIAVKRKKIIFITRYF